ncbi:MAG: DUF2784 domain-containing protein [Proteobacteria bacterium]|nr:DUF2784 domain-containing protein [Pseudomonadota bacterium]
MIWRLLAAMVVVIHFAFAAFCIFGGFLTWRWPRIVWAHLPALAWGSWVEISGSVCPLTPLENHLRELGGAAAYPGDFLVHYLLRALYPPGLTRHVQWLLAAGLLGLNVIAYLEFARRTRGAAARTP